MKKDFTTQVTKEEKALKKRMLTIGSNAMKGFAEGMSSKKVRKKLSKQSRAMADIVVKAFKKKLKIHSPSRVFASLATYTAKGYINQMDAMSRKIANLTLKKVLV